MLLIHNFYYLIYKFKDMIIKFFMKNLNKKILI